MNIFKGFISGTRVWRGYFSQGRFATVQFSVPGRRLSRWAWALALSGLSANLFGAVGPNYHRPAVPTETNYTDIDLGTWKPAVSADALVRGNWWSVFHDVQLDELEREAAQSNQDLKAAIARVTQARALARSAKAEFFPSLSFDPSASRTRYSETTLNTEPHHLGNDIRVPLDLSYELDLWGRVRR